MEKKLVSKVVLYGEENDIAKLFADLQTLKKDGYADERAMIMTKEGNRLMPAGAYDDLFTFCNCYEMIDRLDAPVDYSLPSVRKYIFDSTSNLSVRHRIATIIAWEKYYCLDPKHKGTNLFDIDTLFAILPAEEEKTLKK